MICLFEKKISSFLTLRKYSYCGKTDPFYLRKFRAAQLCCASGTRMSVSLKQTPPEMLIQTFSDEPWGWVVTKRPLQTILRRKKG